MRARDGHNAHGNRLGAKGGRDATDMGKQLPQVQQLADVAKANGWTMSHLPFYAVQFHRTDSAGVASFVGIRTSERGRVTAATINDGSGVLFTPRTNKFREVCVALSAENT
ncbi:hypothetical protein [Mycolicibacterium sphagni]|uniref:hypothetical protein n=1 Tax=Mycolicibacterium sphagni TaxID=1786 RepID=UPI0021F2C7E6|nr:hypothetical protein [Mycolicibacterium sphagni]MCV7174848.1 hypothetical protein [Mycolicibacterium sphagni]